MEKEDIDITPEKCPNCAKSLKGIFGANLLPNDKVIFINKHVNDNKMVYCTSCAKPLLEKIHNDLVKEKEAIEIRLKRIVQFIPIITTAAPINWEYDIIDIVTTQATAGTGFITELSRSFNDFLGSSSKTTNQKIETTTNLCKMDLRIQCLRKGGNVIIGSDIDFNEIGSGSTNMLMICMAGTAIKVNNISVFRPEIQKIILEATELIQKLEIINQETK